MGEMPVFTFRDSYAVEDYWPEDYVASAVQALERLNWLARPIEDADLATAARVLRGLRDLDLDETDVYPFGLLWALRSTGALREVPGGDRQLCDWREWEETDHVGEPLDFLPDLPASGTQHEVSR